MKLFKRVVKWAILVLVVCVVVVALALVVMARGRLPTLDGTVFNDTLVGEARVVRDEWGVPHITAANEPDAYFALGYVMAQDRLFQMDLLRRVARGELAAVLGPKLVPMDRILRAFRLRAKAEEYFGRSDGLPPAPP